MLAPKLPRLHRGGQAPKPAPCGFGLGLQWRIQPRLAIGKLIIPSMALRHQPSVHIQILRLRQIQACQPAAIAVAVQQLGMHGLLGEQFF